jgi:CDP-diacylglycerol pyrophosphatase
MLKKGLMQRFITRTTIALSLTLAVSACARLAALDSGALWKIVYLRCVPSQEASGTPGQCTAVDLDGHYAILKDISGKSQHLLIPTERISGIESPRVLENTAPDFWADAWASRHYVEASLKQSLPDNQLGLEINSEYQRSQEQLHIHMDCMRADIDSELAPHRQDALNQWRWDTLDGHRYRIMRVTSLTRANDPFRLVARDNKDSEAMATQTILVTAAGPSAQRDGWLVVNSGMDVENGSGTAEPLLDHKCEVAKRR